MNQQVRRQVGQILSLYTERRLKVEVALMKLCFHTGSAGVWYQCLSVYFHFRCSVVEAWEAWCVDKQQEHTPCCFIIILSCSCYTSVSTTNGDSAATWLDAPLCLTDIKLNDWLLNYYYFQKSWWKQVNNLLMSKLNDSLKVQAEHTGHQRRIRNMSLWLLTFISEFVAN